MDVVAHNDLAYAGILPQICKSVDWKNYHVIIR